MTCGTTKTHLQHSTANLTTQKILVERDARNDFTCIFYTFGLGLVFFVMSINKSYENLGGSRSHISIRNLPSLGCHFQAEYKFQGVIFGRITNRRSFFGVVNLEKNSLRAIRFDIISYSWLDFSIFS